MSKIMIRARWGGIDRSAPLTPAIKMAFERHYNIAWATAFSGPNRVEWDYWVTWEAMRRAGHGPPPFDEWVGLLEDETQWDAEKPPVVGHGPLPTTPSSDSSPESPS